MLKQQQKVLFFLKFYIFCLFSAILHLVRFNMFYKHVHTIACWRASEHVCELDWNGLFAVAAECMCVYELYRWCMRVCVCVCVCLFTRKREFFFHFDAMRNNDG